MSLTTTQTCSSDRLPLSSCPRSDTVRCTCSSRKLLLASYCRTRLACEKCSRACAHLWGCRLRKEVTIHRRRKERRASGIAFGGTPSIISHQVNEILQMSHKWIQMIFPTSPLSFHHHPITSHQSPNLPLTTHPTVPNTLETSRHCNVTHRYSPSHQASTPSPWQRHPERHLHYHSLGTAELQSHCLASGKALDGN